MRNIWLSDEEAERLNGWTPQDVGELFEEKSTGRIFELTELVISVGKIWLEQVDGDEMIYADVEDLPRDNFYYA